MDIIDRSIIPALHAAARRHRAAYLGSLLVSFKNRLSGLLHAGSRRTIAWG